jgi:predicted Zn finger-like uncharacterized protein
VSHAFVVQCPACAAGYLLPRTLLGPLGARVTCPACRESFDVDADGARVDDVTDAAPVRAFAPRSDAHGDERAIAREVLDELAARLGDDLAAAARESRLFRDHGRDLIDCFDRYRARAGEQAGAQAFREELLRRWHMDLFPLAEARG